MSQTGASGTVVTESLLDSVSNGDDNLAVADMLRAVTRRVMVNDARGNGHYLRITWHADIGQFVVSHWREDICVAAARIAPEDATAVMGVLVAGLGEAVVQVPGSPPVTADQSTS